MARYANWNSDDAVKRKLQSALYRNRKRNLLRRVGDVLETIVVSAPSITGLNADDFAAAVIGTTIGLVGGNYLPALSGTITRQLYADGVAVAGTGGSSWVVSSAQNGKILELREFENGILKGTSLPAPVEYVAPTASNALIDREYTPSSGTFTFSVASDFTGSGLTYSLANIPAIPGVSISGGTVSVNTSLTGTLTGTTVLVQASNTGGAVISAFTLRVEAPVTTTFSYEFGADTSAGIGSVDVGTSGVTITGGDPSGHWQVTTVSGRSKLSPSAAGDAANLNLGPYVLTLSSGGSATIAVVPGRTVESYEGLEAVLESTATPYGYNIYLREGPTYPNASNKTITPVTFSGTWIPPVPISIYRPDLGMNLDSANYVRVRAHTNEQPVCTSRLEIEPITGLGRIRFTGITWFVPVSGRTTLATGAPASLQFRGAEDCAVDNCKFLNPPFDESSFIQDIQRFSCVRTYTGGASTANRLCRGLVVRDNLMDGGCYGFVAANVIIFLEFIGNELRHNVMDDIKLGAASDLMISWNILTSKRRYRGSSAHPDRMQASAGSATGNIRNVRVWFNLITRGTSFGTDNDGQGIFFSDLPTTYSWEDCSAIGNRLISGYTNGIGFGPKGLRTTIKNNSVMPSATIGNAVNITSSAANNVDFDRAYNIACSGAPFATELQVFTEAQCDANLTAGYSGLLDDVTEPTLATIIANTNIKPGSAADIGIGGVKLGAHQDYINYNTRSFTLPYQLPGVPVPPVVAYEFRNEADSTTLNDWPAMRISINGGLWRTLTDLGLTITQVDGKIRLSGWSAGLLDTPGTNIRIHIDQEQPGEAFSASNSISDMYVVRTGDPGPLLVELPGMPVAPTRSLFPIGVTL